MLGILIPPGATIEINGRVRKPQRILDKDVRIFRDSESGILETCTVLLGVTTVQKKGVRLLVHNSGTQSVYIAPHNRIAKLHEITSTPEKIIDQEEDGLNITTYPIFDSSTDEAWDCDIQLNGTGLPDHDSPPGVNSNKSQNNVFTFQNGEEYELPTGLQIPDTLTIEEQRKSCKFN